MKILLFSLILASAAVMPMAADNPAITGKWQIHNSVAGNESDMACTLTQTENDLTGSCSSDNGSGDLKGKVDNKTVTWTYKSQYNGGPLTLTYKGTLTADDKITGSVTVEEYSVDGDFTATHSK